MKLLGTQVSSIVAQEVQNHCYVGSKFSTPCVHLIYLSTHAYDLHFVRCSVWPIHKR